MEGHRVSAEAQEPHMTIDTAIEQMRRKGVLCGSTPVQREDGDRVLFGYQEFHTRRPDSPLCYCGQVVIMNPHEPNRMTER
jgi:hypothetical protein